jgi:hypothetical protein
MSARDMVMGAAGSNGAAVYVEDVFSTYLYTGNGGAQTINNGIDLAGKGGLVWTKSRAGILDHRLNDTDRGINKSISSNTSSGANVSADEVTSYNANGYTLGASGNYNNGAIGNIYVSWTFRKQPKFFDVVTWTGDGTVSNRAITHNLASVPGMIVTKTTNTSRDWYVYHRSLGINMTIMLNSSLQQYGSLNTFGPTLPTTNTFYVGDSNNTLGTTYVAYIYSHNAGGFGLTGNDNVISCGSFTGSTNPVITLGYEPQWILVKNATLGGNWKIFDNMRGLSGTFNDGSDNILYPNISDAEAGEGINYITATGFNYGTVSSTDTYVYMAIRRGPMKVPTDGTEVFNTAVYTGNGGTQSVISGITTPDLFWAKWRSGSPGSTSHNIWDRLRSRTYRLFSDTVGSEQYSQINSFDGGGVTLNASYANTGATAYAGWFFKRAPKFFDEVCYGGTSINATQPHNLGVIPELIIVKSRSQNTSWFVYAEALGNNASLTLETTTTSGPGQWNVTSPTSTVFSLGNGSSVNGAGHTFVAYLFATCPGVSKVGSYTGNGTSQTIACGFAAGARFILIKCTSAVGDWYVWDTSRGIITGNDPHLSLNTISAEVTTDDSIDPAASGFIVNQVAATNINVTSATYIFLSIA